MNNSSFIKNRIQMKHDAFSANILNDAKRIMLLHVRLSILLITACCSVFSADLEVKISPVSEFYYKNEPVVVRIEIRNASNDSIGLCFSYGEDPVALFALQDDKFTKKRPIYSTEFVDINQKMTYEYYLPLDSYITLKESSCLVKCQLTCIYMRSHAEKVSSLIDREISNHAIKVSRLKEKLDQGKYIRQLFSGKSAVKDSRDAQFSCAKHLDADIVTTYVENDFDKLSEDPDRLLELLCWHKSNEKAILFLRKLLSNRMLRISEKARLDSFRAIAHCEKMNKELLVEQITFGREDCVLEFLKSNEKKEFFPDVEIIRISESKNSDLANKAKQLLIVRGKSRTDY